MRKRIVKFLLYTAMLIFCVNTFSAFTAYGFFDHLSANKSDINLSIGEGFWDNSYIFAELDPQNYNTTGIWNVNTEGFISNNGNIYFNNRKSEYLITSTAILSGDSITHGAYRIYFESTLNENNLIDGYALVFDNINSNVKIVEIVNGNVSSSLLTYNNSTNAFLPLNTSSIEWRQNHEIVIEICESPTSGFKYLNVWIDNNKLVTDYLVDSVENTINNITGYFSHPLQTTFITLDIVDYNSNIFTITFNSDGGSNVNSIRQESGTAISQPANPTKEGYTFDCWTLNGNTYTFTTMPAANITLIASWQVNQYTIAFNSNGGSTVSPITQDFGTSVSEPTPTRTGHTFNGWYSDAGLTNSYTFTTMPSQNITVYAKWTINSYTITFDSAGGSAVAPITQNYGTSVSQPTNPAKAGYSFDKWILNSNPYIFTIMPSQNITLVATWIELAATEYTIIFDSNGGSVVTSIVEEEGNLISAPTAPTRTGYTFNNWFSDTSLTTLYVFDIMPSQNMTLYAKWTINSYTISFNSNGGSAVSPITQNYGTSVSAPIDPTKAGNIFIKWTLSGNPYIFTTMPSQNITLVATWEVIQFYTITFNSNGGSTVSSIVQQNGTFLSAPTAHTRTGYTFNGWYADAGLSNLYVFNIMPNVNMTLYAKWTINSYTITFITNGGSPVAPITQNYGTTIIAPTNPVKSGNYFFAGWYSEAQLQNEFVFNTIPATNLNVFADWGSTGLTFVELWNGYSVTGSTSEASIIQIPQRYQGLPVVDIAAGAFNGNTYIQSINIPHTVTSIGKGTFSNASALQELYIPINVTSVGKDAFQNSILLTINAQAVSVPSGWHTHWNSSLLSVNWGAVFIPNLIFNSNGGSVVAPITQVGGSSISAPTPSTKTGYTFNGWYADAGLTTAYVFNIMPAQNIIIYAKWTINSYTISFNSDGGSAVNALTQNYATTVSAPTNPTKVGYLFTYWTLGGNVYSFTTMPAQNITLLAVWTELVASEYTITFNSNGGSVVASIVEEEGSLVSAPTAPTRIGYTFNGWYADVGLTTLYVFNLMPSEDITLYAKWTISQYTITFVTNGGSAISPVTQNYGTIITAPVNPIKTGNLFSGWYSNSKLKNEFIFGGALESSFTLYADWGTTNLTYQLIGGIGYRVVSGDPTLTTIQIPQKYLGIPVVEIGASAFINYTLLQYINIPYSVTTIGTSAFERCTALRQIYIPINVISIGADVFKQSRAATIRVEATSKPLGWNADWSKNGGTVIWGVSDN